MDNRAGRLFRGDPVLARPEVMLDELIALVGEGEGVTEAEFAARFSRERRVADNKLHPTPKRIFTFYPGAQSVSRRICAGRLR